MLREQHIAASLFRGDGFREEQKPSPPQLDQTLRGQCLLYGKGSQGAKAGREKPTRHLFQAVACIAAD
jgi:hypothetical protein